MPIRPININAAITACPTLERSPVIPSERPVVPKAEQTSTMMAIRGCSSVAVKKIIEKKHMLIDNMKTITDLRISASGIRRPKILILSSLFKKEYMYKPMMAIVVVRMPPPTELGEQPINIKIEKIINVVT